MINQDLINKLNKYGSLKEPYLFIISYDKKSSDFFLLKDLPSNIEFEINTKSISKSSSTIKIKKELEDYQIYKNKFDLLQKEIKAGNSYLLNLTSKTKISLDIDLKEIYNISKARFKLKYKDEFVCFTPERFINIKDNKISTYPMKGTIDASFPSASETILNDIKEMAEHTMAVDLLRNDLSIVSSKVRVNKFRYVEKINAGSKELLQISSEIQGDLDPSWPNNIGNILDNLLPAGSITGTPKKNTIKILEDIENYDRKYYTGIAGVFDGEKLETFVLIRFIENIKGELFYKSGGGITCDSICKNEYVELADKIYIPT
ncbi:MAG: aminodeoxychorismate synthase component I [Campylobacteraceae bacterium]|nr:aminodeoxychorismate synthase component I [Campylobacteraceae bacterium]